MKTNEEIIAEIDKRTQELMDEYEDRCSSQWEADVRRKHCLNKAIIEALNAARTPPPSKDAEASLSVRTGTGAIRTCTGSMPVASTITKPRDFEATTSKASSEATAKRDDEAIAEFKKEILKSTGLPDWCSLSWYNRVEQAAQNLFDKARAEGYSKGLCDGGKE